MSRSRTSRTARRPRAAPGSRRRAPGWLTTRRRRGSAEPALQALRRPRRRAHGRRGQRQRHRFQLVGRVGRTHHHRQAAAGQRPAPVGLAALGLVPDGPALHRGLQQVPVRRLRLHLRGHARRDNRPQPEHRVGHDQLRGRRHRPVPGEDHRERLPVRRQGAALHHPQGNDQDRGRRQQDDRRAHHQQRTSAVRPRRRAGQGRQEGHRRRRGARRGGGYAIALRWTALDPGTSMDAVFRIDKASGWDEFRKAAQSFEVPSQNLVYADGKGPKGHIGYQLPGKIPIRPKGDDGSLPRPAGTPSTAGPATTSSRPNCPTSSTRSAATSSPPTRPSSTRTSTPTRSPRTGATARAASGSPI